MCCGMLFAMCHGMCQAVCHGMCHTFTQYVVVSIWLTVIYPQGADRSVRVKMPNLLCYRTNYVTYLILVLAVVNELVTYNDCRHTKL